MLDETTRDDIKCLINTSKRLGLTVREAEVLYFLDSTIRETGQAPTRWELAEKFGLKSANSAQQYLRQLERKGMIRMVPQTIEILRTT